MVQRGRSLRFPLETAEGLCVVGEFIGKELESNVAAQLQVFCLVHHTHPAPTDLAQDAVMGDGLTHGIGRSSHWREWYGEAGRRSISLPSVDFVLFENDHRMLVSAKKM